MKKYKLSEVRKMSQGERKEIVFKAFEELRAERDEAVGLLKLILSDEGNGVMAWHVDRVNAYLAKLGGKDG